jgi:hypothetical protein
MYIQYQNFISLKRIKQAKAYHLSLELIKTNNQATNLFFGLLSFNLWQYYHLY